MSVGHDLSTEDVRTAERAEPVRVVAWCRCGGWHLSLTNDADVDLDEQIAFAFEAHTAGIT